MGKPRIGITIGDVAGIGPEVAVKAALDRRVAAACQPVLIGPREFWAMAAAQCRRSVAKLPMHDVYCEGFDVSAGNVSAQTGRIAARAVAAAAVMALDGQIAAVATAPIS